MLAVAKRYWPPNSHGNWPPVSSTPAEKFVYTSSRQRLACIGPLERLGHSSIRRLGNSLLDVGQKVGLGAARPHAGRYHLMQPLLIIVDEYRCSDMHRI